MVKRFSFLVLFALLAIGIYLFGFFVGSNRFHNRIIKEIELAFTGEAKPDMQYGITFETDEETFEAIRRGFSKKNGKVKKDVAFIVGDRERVLTFDQFEELLNNGCVKDPAKDITLIVPGVANLCPCSKEKVRKF